MGYQSSSRVYAILGVVLAACSGIAHAQSCSDPDAEPCFTCPEGVISPEYALTFPGESAECVSVTSVVDTDCLNGQPVTETPTVKYFHGSEPAGTCVTPTANDDGSVGSLGITTIKIIADDGRVNSDPRHDHDEVSLLPGKTIGNFKVYNFVPTTFTTEWVDHWTTNPHGGDIYQHQFHKVILGISDDENNIYPFEGMEIREGWISVGQTSLGQSDAAVVLQHFKDNHVPPPATLGSDNRFTSEGDKHAVGLLHTREEHPSTISPYDLFGNNDFIEIIQTFSAVSGGGDIQIGQSSLTFKFTKISGTTDEWEVWTCKNGVPGGGNPGEDPDPNVCP